MAESTATLQAKLKALTHGKVDIMEDADTFKSTTQILREMADAWEYMTDIERASALELMGGKRQANILSSLINNFDIVEDVIQTSLNSENSAIEENAKYLDSMQGRIDQLNNSLQSMWVNAMDSEFLKFLISATDGFVQLTDEVGLLNAAMAVFMGKSAFGAKNFGILNMIPGLATKATSAMTSLGMSATAAATGFSIFNAAATAGLSLLAGLLMAGIAKLADELYQSAEEIKEAANEVVDAYNDAQKTLASNKKTISSIADDYEKLSSGVDRLGNNISLTTDEYTRYNEIVNQIADMFPTMVSGYTAEGNAILSTKGNVEELTKAYQEQAEAARNAVILGGDKVFADAKNDIESTKEQIDAYNVALAMANGKTVKDAKDWYGDSLVNQAIKILEKYGFEQNFNQYASGNTATTYGLPTKWDKTTQTYVDDYTYDEEVEHAQRINKLMLGRNDLLLKQQGALSKVNTVLQAYLDNNSTYAGMEEESQSAISSIVSSLDPADFDYDDDKMEAFILSNIIAPIYENKDGVQEALNNLLTLDENETSYQMYEGLKAALLTAIANLPAETQDAIKKAFGLGSDSGYETYLNHTKKILQDEYDDMASGLTLAELEIAGQLDIPDGTLLTWEELKQKISEVMSALMSNTDSVKTYSVLTAGVDNYNDILTQTSEIVADNTSVTQDYKDSLTDLGLSTEEINDCFDEQNPLIVKNAALLRKLVNQKKQEQKATIQASKAYSQLQYKTTVGQIRQLISSMEAEVKATGYVSAATLENVDVLQEQLTALQQTIQQYALLELKLSSAASAYNEFEAAKQRDAELTYGDSMVEMLQVINDGFKTGQVGSEAFQAAVKALVPESVYKDVDDLQERMQRIHDYIDKNPIFADYFTIKDGNFSITMDNIKNFIQDGLKDGVGAEFGVFTGTLDDFDLSDQITSVKDLADAYGITEAAALAMLTEFEKYDASWSDIIADLTTTPLDRKINEATDSLDKALQAQKDFITSGKPLYDENGEMTEGYKAVTEAVNSAQNALDDATQKAIDNAQTYTQVEAVLKGMSGEVKYTQEQADALARSLGLVNENGECTINIDDDGKLQLTQSQIEILNKSLTGLTKPTIMDIQLAYDQIDEQIKGLENRDATILAEFELTNASDEEINNKIKELTENKKVIELIYNITTTSTEQATGNMEKLATWETNGINITITGDASGLNTAVAEANALEVKDKDVNITADPTQANSDIDSVDNNNIADKEPVIAMQGVSIALTDINSIDDALDALPSTKTVTVSVNYEQSGSVDGGSDANGNFHISGGAFASGTVGAPRTETALVGELGPELLVRNGRWTTVGDNGAEFTQVKKGDIIFNHKQTESLLKNGYVTSRGRAYASGTAYKYGIFDDYVGDDDAFENGSDKWVDPLNKATDGLSKAADALSDSSDEFKEVFDWIEVRLEEINEDISLKGAQLENKVGHSAQNKVIDKMIALNQKLYDNLIAGANEYNAFAKELLKKVPEEHRKAAQDGTIAIETFVGEVDEKTLEAIQNYREWVQKGADATQQAEETLTEISNLAKQAIDNISADYDNKTSLRQNKIDQYEAYNSLLETDKGFESAEIYQKMITENNKNIKTLEQQRDKMQAELNKRVESGEIKKYSQDWYDAVNDIAAVDTEIIELKTDTENWQDAINELHWDKFDALISRLESVSNEAENLIDILGNEDMVDESGNWTDAGITSLGLHTQRMEAAEVQAKKYADEIAYLDKNWEKLGYTEEEYLEKRDELKDSQYDAIKSYHDEKDAIVDLNKKRVDAIKKGIEKEIEAYEELIKTKKEELDAEKDLYDFQKNIADKQKNIADIQRKLAALSADNSASARAKRAQLEAELAEAQEELQDAYYDRSISDQQDALDKELENFQETKDKEMEGWDEYLENTNQVVSDSLAIVQANTETVYHTLQAMGEEYSLSITESLTSPWQEGESAIQSFSEKFGISMSATVEELEELELEFKETMLEIERAGVDAANTVKENAQRYTEAEYQESENNGGSGGGNGGSGGDSSAAGLVSSLSGNIEYGNSGSNVKKLQRALNELGYGNSGTSGVDGIFGDKTLEAVKKFQKDMGIPADGIVGTETKKKFKLKGYAKGTKGTPKDQWSILDELGEELELIPDGNGRLAYMKKGTGVVPADLTTNLMEWGKLDPTNMLEQNKPQIGVSPSVVNNTTEIHIDASVGELLHVEHLEGNNPAEISKIVDKAWDKHMKELNAHVRRYTNR